MPRGPEGIRRPAEVIGNAVRVMRIATGEESKGLETGSPASTGKIEQGRSGALSQVG
jgi:hypothetical protein